MKTPMLIALFFLLSATPGFAIHWEFIGQDSPRPVYQGDTEVKLSQPVGEITIQILDKNKIPYVGNEKGLNSILGTVIGEASLVIESDEKMRVYGWCFEIDGVQPNVMPDKAFLPKQQSQLKWFYGFMSYDKGKWNSYCTPAYTLPLKVKP